MGIVVLFLFIVNKSCFSFYNCNKSITSEPFEQPPQEPDVLVNNDNAKSSSFRTWLFSYLPIIYSHACTFILGAATLVFYNLYKTILTVLTVFYSTYPMQLNWES